MTTLAKEFDKMNTKVLLKALDEFRVFNSCQKKPDNADDDWSPPFKNGDTWNSANFRGYVFNDKLYIDLFSEWPDAPGISEKDLKAVLVTREHVPNKNERRKMRQEKARMQQGKRKRNNENSNT